MFAYNNETSFRIFTTKADLTKWLSYTSVEVFNLQTQTTHEGKLIYHVTYMRAAPNE